MRSIHVMALLERLPPGLTQLYSRIYDQVITNDEFPEMTKYATQILKAIVLATRPLTVGEVAVIAGLPRDAWEDEKIAEEYLEQCGSFISVRAKDAFIREREDFRVHVVHQSAKDYLLLGREVGIFAQDCTIEHEAITIRCLRYIDCVDAVPQSRTSQSGFDDRSPS
jgi:hypothetical protein